MGTVLSGRWSCYRARIAAELEVKSDNLRHNYLACSSHSLNHRLRHLDVGFGDGERR